MPHPCALRLVSPALSGGLPSDEKVRGLLEPGKLADFVILGTDPTKAPPRVIRTIPVVEPTSREKRYGAASRDGWKQRRRSNVPRRRSQPDRFRLTPSVQSLRSEIQCCRILTGTRRLTKRVESTLPTSVTVPTVGRPNLVLVTVLLSTVTGWQNPSSPDVILPNGWGVHYWSSQGFGTGAILGPNGEEIVFPGYGGTGAMAATTHEGDPASLYIRAIVDGRRIDVAVRADGYLAVSYPPIPDPKVPYFRSFDYWTVTKTARQTAQAIAISLTRLEVRRSSDRKKDGPSLKEAEFAPTTPGFPFDSISVGSNYSFVGPSQSGGVSFDDRKGLVVALQAAAPAKSKWEERMSLVGRELRWGEDASGHLWASASASGSKAAVFVASASKPRAAALAILMALTYKP